MDIWRVWLLQNLTFGLLNSLTSFYKRSAYFYSRSTVWFLFSFSYYSIFFYLHQPKLLLAFLYFFFFSYFLNLSALIWALLRLSSNHGTDFGQSFALKIKPSTAMSIAFIKDISFLSVSVAVREKATGILVRCFFKVDINNGRFIFVNNCWESKKLFTVSTIHLN